MIYSPPCFNYKKYPFPKNIVCDAYGEERMNDDDLCNRVLIFIDTKIPDRLRMAVHYRYDNKFTLKETGKLMGISEERVLQLVHTVLRKIRQEMNIVQPDEKAESKTIDINSDILELRLSVRSYNGLHRWRGVRTIGDLLSLEKDDLYKTRNMGPKSVQDIIQALEKCGFNADKFK